jgi:hypothetical protein
MGRSFLGVFGDYSCFCKSVIATKTFKHLCHFACVTKITCSCVYRKYLCMYASMPSVIPHVVAEEVFRLGLLRQG